MRHAALFRARYPDRLIEARNGGAEPIEMLLARVPAGETFGTATPTLALSLVTTGTAHAQIDVGAGAFADRYRQGSITLQIPNVAATFAFNASLEGLILSIPVSRVRTVLSSITDAGPGDAFGVLHTRSTHDEFVERTMYAVWDELAADGPHGMLFVDHAVSALLLRLAGLAGARSWKALRGGLAPWQVRRIIDFLSAHLEEDVALAQLARLVGLSSTAHFCRAFRVSMGMPPYRWLLMRRIERARVLLSTTDLSITAIAFACGFSSSQHLATAFRREVGASPTQYRRVVRE